MGFAAPGLLPLAALALVPLIIHLLSRLRLRRVAFPSLLLLQSVRRERFSWVRLKEVLLLILRTLALLALLLALARPFVRGRVPGLGQARDVVLLVDDSYSMSAGTRWRQARAVTRELVGGLAPGSRVTLRTSSAGTEPGPVSRPAALVAIDSLQPTGRADRLEPALTRAAEAARAGSARLVVVTDLQRRAGPDTWPRLAPPVLVLDVGAETPANYTLSSLSVTERLGAVVVTAQATSHGTAVSTRTVSLAGTGIAETRPATLPPGGTQSVEFAPGLAGPGPHLLEARLSLDSMAADDARFVVVPARSVTRLLLVDAEPASHLAQALAADSGVVRTTQVTPALFGRQNLERFDLVVLAGPAALRPGDWNRFDFFLRSGGAGWLLLEPEPGTPDRPAYARSAQAVRPAPGFHSVVDPGASHPLTAPLAGAGWPAVHVWQHALVRSPDLRPVVTLSDGSALIAEHAELRLVVWSIPAGPGFSDLGQRALFAPLVHRTVGYLAGRDRFRSLTCGDTIVVRPGTAAPALVITPTRRQTVATTSELGRPVVRYAGTEFPGFYRVVSGSDTTVLAVNPDPAEGDLGRVEPGELRRAGVDVRAGVAGESDLSTALLLLAALAFVLEMLVLLV